MARQVKHALQTASPVRRLKRVMHLCLMLRLQCLFRTWSSTLLQSSNEVFTYGISGAFWYAAGAVLQVGAKLPHH